MAFLNPNNYLRPGQFARIRAVIAARDNAVVIPQRAIVELQGAQTVMVVDDQNKVSVRTVKVGEKSDQEIIILEGLKPGERIVVEGMQKVRPGGEVMRTTGEETPVTQEG